MRSYEYSLGVWSLIDDPLPREASEKRDYRYSNNPGDLRIPNTLVYENQKKAYKDTLQSLGFSTAYRHLECDLGKVEVYSKDHVDLDEKRVQGELRFDFFCVLRAPDSYIRIWIPDLPNLLLFLREIEAHKVTPEPKYEVAEVLNHFLQDEDLQGLIVSANWIAGKLSMGELEIGIKQPDTKKK